VAIGLTNKTKDLGMAMSTTRLRAHRVIFALIALSLLGLAIVVWTLNVDFGLEAIKNHRALAGMLILTVASDLGFIASCAHDALLKRQRN
jgi:hypothetical protein